MLGRKTEAGARAGVEECANGKMPSSFFNDETDEVKLLAARASYGPIALKTSSSTCIPSSSDTTESYCVSLVTWKLTRG